MIIQETNLAFGSLSVRNKTLRAILHHADASVCDAATIHQWHKNQGWSGIGYHFVVRKDGTIQRGRPEWAVGAHSTGSNSDSIGICVEGDYTKETMPNVQKKAVIELLVYLKKKYGFTTVQGHRDVYPTTCPGNNYPFNDIVAGRMSYVNAGWKHDSKGWWYQNSDGTYPKSQWLKLDTWYYFNANGYAYENKWILYKDKWYYLGADCRMVTGWKKVDGHWYYLGTDGTMKDGWVKVNDSWYYLVPEKCEIPHGAMWTGTIEIDGFKYLLDETSGAMVIGWHKDENENWHYFNKNLNCQPVGSMLHNHWITDNKKKYYLKEDGVMAKNEDLLIDGVDYSFDENGALK